ncbi:hypothetical protein V5799_011552 [Amblyomma americanum]|uniref:Fucosyltransferase n=1 Tax=Amblyomma americanum TaxID=6943 RepID=A0AAQ4EGX1_AMBAM
MRYKKEVEEASMFYTRWRPWYGRDLPGVYLDDEVDNPRILLWSVPTLEWEKDEPLPAHGERVLQACPDRDDGRTCFVTRKRHYLGRADAILFDADNLNYYDYPALRHRGQVWVIWTRGKPPLNPSYDLLSMAAKFNWTMSYRGDADVTVPYSMWAPPPMGLSYESLNQTIRKKKTVGVWLVSECEDDRLAELALVKLEEIRSDFELARFVALATSSRIIKNCGGDECKNRHECLKNFQNQYFFLFVVESSPCFEHPHEIMFDALHYSIIPIYFGSSSLGSTVPPFSVFDTTAAASAVEAVGAILNIYVRYERYLDCMKWKEKYRIAAPGNDLCALCDALYENRNRTTNDDVVQWWKRGSDCKILPGEKVYPLATRDMLRPYTSS